MTSEPRDFAFGRYLLAQDGVLWRGRTRVPLPPKETALLLLLAESGGRIVAKTEIFDRLWPGEDVGEASITRCVRGLRRALREKGRRGGTIETVHGQGYRLGITVRSASTLREGEPVPIRLGVGAFEQTRPDRPSSYLGVAIAGEVTDCLAKARADGVTVIARQYAGRLARGASELLPNARALRLDYVVTGWLDGGEEVRVRAELVRVRDGTLVWSDGFRARSARLARMPASIAAGVVGTLGRLASLPSPIEPVRPPGVNSKSYLAVLQGRFASQLRSERGVRRACELFERAIDWDPHHAEAYAALADTLLVLAFWGYEAPLAIVPRVRSLTRSAFALDRRLVDAHASHAYLRYAIDHDPAAALRAVERALALQPGHARSEWIRAVILQSQGRFDEALTAFELARESDPFSPQLALGIAFNLFCMQQLEPALAAARALTGSEPEFALGHAVRAAIALAVGRADEAVRSAEVAEGCARGSAVALGGAAWVLAKAGHAGRADQIREALERKAARRYVPAHSVALAALALGDVEAAIAWLQRGLAERSLYLPHAAIDPRFAELRGDPRFEGLTVLARGRGDATRRRGVARLNATVTAARRSSSRP